MQLTGKEQARQPTYALAPNAAVRLQLQELSKRSDSFVSLCGKFSGRGQNKSLGPAHRQSSVDLSQGHQPAQSLPSCSSIETLVLVLSVVDFLAQSQGNHRCFASA